MLRNIVKIKGWAIFTIFLILSLNGCGGGGGDGSVAINCGDNEAVYVRMDADESNPGTISEPLGTIQAAVACAVPGQDIRVSNGTYYTDNFAGGVVRGNVINLEEGKSMYGGYSSDFQARDPAVYTTIITDITDLSVFPWYNVYPVFAELTTQETVIDGFTINGSSIGAASDNSVGAIYIGGGSLTITNNIINGGGNSNIHLSHGIVNYPYGLDHRNGGAIINNNTIHGGVAMMSYGVYATSTNAPIEITNNIIHGGAATSVSHAIWISGDGGKLNIADNSIAGGGEGEALSYGIRLYGDVNGVIEANSIKSGDTAESFGIYNSGAPSIRNNTIRLEGLQATGIYNAANSDISNNTIVGSGTENTIAILVEPFNTAKIQNNILGVTNGICIAEADNNSDPVSLKNNDLSGCVTLYVDEGVTDITNIADVNALSETDASDNVSLPPNLDGAQDYQLTGSSPVAITQGGLDLSSDFNIDKAGNVRTVPWSMGAYEYD